jgi:hypothetical protein
MAQYEARRFNEGDTGTNKLQIHVGAWAGTDYTLDPGNSEIIITRGPPAETKTLLVDDFTDWTVTTARTDLLEFDLGNDSKLQLFASGIVRFVDADSNLEFSKDHNDVDVDDHPYHLHEIDTDWFIASDEAWDLTGNALNTTDQANTTIFYNTRGKEDWIAHLNLLDMEDLYVGGSNWEKLMRVLRQGFFAEWERSRDELREYQAVVDQTGPALTKTAKFWNVFRDPGQSDESLLVDLKLEIAKQIGGVTVTELQGFVESALGGSEGDIAVTLNKDPNDGAYRQRRIEFSIPQPLLEGLGFASPFDDELSSIEKLLNRVTAGGVKGIVTLISTAEYGSGNLLDNASYEDYPSDGEPPEWDANTGAGASFSSETSIVDHGDISAKVVTSGTTTGDQGLKQLFNPSSTTEWSVSLRARTGGSGGEQARLGLRDVTDSTLVNEASGTSSATSWETLGFTEELEEDHVYEFEATQNGVPGSDGLTLYFDDCKVEWDEDVAEYDSGDVFGS